MKPFDLPDHATMAANLAATLADATRAEQDTGLAWYDTAHTFTIGLADRYDLPLEHAAGIIAALSPGCDWERNLTLADTMAATGDCRHPFGNAIRKARAIWTGALPSETLGGDKVRNFFCNILAPGCIGPVTIDRHAVSVLVGHKVEGLPSRKGYYERCAKVYREAAAQAGLAPHQVQAISWLAWRRNNPALRWAGKMGD